ncbi:MAG: hypothetical protein A2284_12785 [Deltaproteobacteria bacterium RIFOXYA12_FULL_61_11]|nr:MAG: hypothetical protein A2284_12785 [Deltaproteobacteria bacterium RIFOXYA12_FULL_61_11]
MEKGPTHVEITVVMRWFVPGFLFAFSLQVLALEPKDVLSAQIALEGAPPQAGQSATVIVRLSIRNEWHINSAKPLQTYLIPTSLAMTPSSGIALGEVLYPEGVLRRFPFATEELSVYEGLVELRAPLTAPRKPGKYPLTFKLRYQACDQRTCLPPTTLDTSFEFEVLASTTPKPPRP